jgi:hypothetical protein
VSVASVRYEVANVLVPEGSTAIVEDGEVNFFGKVIQCILVLRDDVGDTGDIRTNNFEIKGSRQ